ncbi:MAG: cation-translocating P-type ATPase [Bacteroidia bacterium]
MKNAHSLSVSDILSQLGSTTKGLSAKVVEERIKTHGLNKIQDTKARPWYILLFGQFNSLLVYILVGAAVISGFSGHIVDVYVIAGVILLNTMIGFVQELKAEKAVASLKNMLVLQAKVIREGIKNTINAEGLVPGDIIILEEGDSIPADARILESKNLRAIEAPLTGESVPVEKNSEVLPENTALADRSNMLFKSTFIAGGFATAVVTGTGYQTAIGDIATTLKSIKKERTNFQKKTDVLARQMAVIAICSALLLFTVSYFMQNAGLQEILLISIAALVSSIPEGLPAVLAIVLAIGANRMAKRKAIIREFTATETLGAVTTIITDKTGTLTQNTLTVRKVIVGLDDEWNITGEGWIPTGNFLKAKDNSVDEIEENIRLQKLLQIAALCNNSSIQHVTETNTYKLIGDPTEGALLVLAKKATINTKDFKKIDDLPFNSSLKLRATLIEDNNKKELFVIGAPEKILQSASFYITKHGVEPITEEIRDKIRTKIEGWSDEAMRVIALAYKEIGSSTNKIEEGAIKDLVLCGITGMIDPPRPDVKNAVEQCKMAGIRVIMATGDHINTGVAVAKATGIISQQNNNEVLALTEQQLLALDDKEFEQAILKVSVFARLTPNMKMRIANTLQQRGELIAMTGDGVNDAPALKKADVGVAMGIMGTDVARDSAKVVLADDNFSTIVSAIEEGRIVFNNTRYTSFFLLTTNFAEIATLLSAVLMGLPIPLTATQILWLNLVTDGACTTAMATESGHGNELKEKPVNPKEKILNKSILPFLLINSVLMAVLALAAFKYFLPFGIEKARTGAFVVMAFSQLYNVFNMRDIKTSIFKIGFFTNKFINIGLVVSIILQVIIIEVPFFEMLFQFKRLSFAEFTILALASSMVLWVGELYKYFRYKNFRINQSPA